MSNFIDERERHAELYGSYSCRQKELLDMVQPYSHVPIGDNMLVSQLHYLGITDTEISWLKRTGHVLPVL